MRCYKELYGADADGNRGQWIYECELEPSDSDEIVRQIEDYLKDNGINHKDDYPDGIEVTLFNPYTDDDVQFTVDIKDYL